jgi:hypothetical protein
MRKNRKKCRNKAEFLWNENQASEKIILILRKSISMENIQPENGKNSKFKKWFKRVGIGGLIFFTVKGIAWLFVFYYGAELFQDCSAK